MSDIEIKPLTPTLIADFLDFFDNVAFTDHPDWSQCYCMAFHWKREWDDEPERSFREWALELINDGLAQGYLAYSDGKVIGWCNSNDKSNYAALKHNVNLDLLTDNEDTKVKSVVCFLVAPELRGKGVATKLLERVCDDAATDGYDYIEGYPLFGECDMYAAHHGTVGLFKKCGFTIYKQIAHDCVVRKYLKKFKPIT